MYLPDCTDITFKNIYYKKNTETGMFDTRDAAQTILASMADAHRDQLKELPQTLEGGSGSLFDLCTLPDSASHVRPLLCLLLVLPCVVKPRRTVTSAPPVYISARYIDLFCLCTHIGTIYSHTCHNRTACNAHACTHTVILTPEQGTSITPCFLCKSCVLHGQ
jgi:hypothetical protein